MTDTTRAQFLTRAGKGGLALVAGGTVLGLAQGTAFGKGMADADIAKLAATAELLAIDFYSRAIASRKLTGDELSYLAGAKGNEVAHYNALKGVLKSATPTGLKFKYPAGSLTRAAALSRAPTLPSPAARIVPPHSAIPAAGFISTRCRRRAAR